MEEPGGLQSMHSQRVRNDWATSLWFTVLCWLLEYSKVIQLWVCVYTYIFFQIYIWILFHYGLSHDVEYGSMCCTVGPCLSTCLSTLYTVYLLVYLFFIYSSVYLLIPDSSLIPPHPPSPLGNHKFAFSWLTNNLIKDKFICIEDPP